MLIKNQFFRASHFKNNSYLLLATNLKETLMQWMKMMRLVGVPAIEKKEPYLILELTLSKKKVCKKSLLLERLIFKMWKD